MQTNLLLRQTELPSPLRQLHCIQTCRYQNQLQLDKVLFQKQLSIQLSLFHDSIAFECKKDLDRSFYVHKIRTIFHVCTKQNF